MWIWCCTKFVLPSSSSSWANTFILFSSRVCSSSCCLSGRSYLLLYHSSPLPVLLVTGTVHASAQESVKLSPTLHQQLTHWEYFHVVSAGWSHITQQPILTVASMCLQLGRSLSKLSGSSTADGRTQTPWAT